MNWARNAEGFGVRQCCGAFWATATQSGAEPPHFKTLCALLFLAGATCAVGRDQPTRHEIPNFGRVNDQLYRGAQPGVLAIQNLRNLRVGLIINLRMPEEVWKLEAAQAAASGIAYTNIPMQKSGWPSDEQVGKILALIQTSTAPVFVHCHRGCDRTGTVIACYRIEHDHWSSKDALREAKHFGMSWRRREMKRYVTEFARGLSPSPEHVKGGRTP